MTWFVSFKANDNSHITEGYTFWYGPLTRKDFPELDRQVVREVHKVAGWKPTETTIISIAKLDDEL